MIENADRDEARFSRQLDKPIRQLDAIGTDDVLDGRCTGGAGNEAKRFSRPPSPWSTAQGDQIVPNWPDGHCFGCVDGIRMPLMRLCRTVLSRRSPGSKDVLPSEDEDRPLCLLQAFSELILVCKQCRYTGRADTRRVQGNQGVSSVDRHAPGYSSPRSPVAYCRLTVSQGAVRDGDTLMRRMSDPSEEHPYPDHHWAGRGIGP